LLRSYFFNIQMSKGSRIVLPSIFSESGGAVAYPLIIDITADSDSDS